MKIMLVLSRDVGRSLWILPITVADECNSPSIFQHLIVQMTSSQTPDAVTLLIVFVKPDSLIAAPCKSASGAPT